MKLPEISIGLNREQAIENNHLSVTDPMKKIFPKNGAFETLGERETREGRQRNAGCKTAETKSFLFT